MPVSNGYPLFGSSDGKQLSSSTPDNIQLYTIFACGILEQLYRASWLYLPVIEGSGSTRCNKRPHTAARSLSSDYIVSIAFYIGTLKKDDAKAGQFALAAATANTCFA